MGPVFVILFWLIIASVFGAFWIASLVIFLIGKRKSSRLIMCLGGIPLSLITVVAIAAVSLIGYGIIRSINPKYVYKDAFGEVPSRDVSEIRSKVYGFADEAHVFLTFKAPPETVHRIVPKNLKRVSFEDYKRQMPGNNLVPPSWWKAPDTSTTEIYLLSPDYGAGEKFASETTLMTYQTETNAVMYFYIGID